MTATDLTALLAADLTERDNRMVLSDALEEAGREAEAILCRGKEHLWVSKGVVTIDTKRIYYEESPRHFANEYTVYVMPRGWWRRFEAAFPGADRIYRRDAVRRGWVRPREARRDSEFWCGGFCMEFAHGFTDDLSQALFQCEISTIRAIEQDEMEKEYCR